MLKPSDVLQKYGLKSWSHVSEDTKGNLSQVPWIREKVGNQDKSTNDLQDVGTWAGVEPRYTESPQPGPSGADSDTENIDLEAGVRVPEFSIRIVDENGPPKRPIWEVLGDVRRSFGSSKSGTVKRPRGATTASRAENLNQKTVSHLRESTTPPAQRFLEERSAPWAPLSTDKTNLPNSPISLESDKISMPTHKDIAKVKPPRHNSWLPSYLALKPRRQGSNDSQNCELQLFPAEIASEENWRDIQQRLPESIRRQCTFKEDYWWYNGDSSDLSGLSKDKSFAGSKAGIGDPRQSSHPVIQKGSITIAGRPLLIERCFKDASSSTWTCKPDDIMMTDTPIPGLRDGKTVVVPLASLPIPPRLKRTKDPLPKTIDPREYSNDDLKSIAKYVSPHEFCLYLDGTLQVMLSAKQLEKIKEFPTTIGGLSVSFSSGTVRQSAGSKAVDASTSSHGKPSKMSSSQRQTKVGAPSAWKAAQSPGRDVYSSKNILNKSSPPSTNTPKLENQTGGEVKEADLESGDQKTKTSGSPAAATPLNMGQNGSAGLSTDRPEASDDAKRSADPAPLTGSLNPESPIPNSRVPFGVIIGKTIELGIPCFVGVKILDSGVEKITVPTSAALEAACKARKESGPLKRLKNRVGQHGEVSVLDLNVWTNTEPPRKIGIISRCFDALPDKPLTIHSVHPDDLPYDVCLVTGAENDSFASVTSPSHQWWVKAHKNEASGIVQDTVLHIVCPEDRRQESFAIDGMELQNLARTLPSAVIQGVRVVIRKDLLCTSTLYRFLGPVTSWVYFRGAAVVEVNQTTKTWDSVVGLHSFEYLTKDKGHSEKPMPWKHIEDGLLKGNISFWGCRHLPEELLEMPLLHT